MAKTALVLTHLRSEDACLLGDILDSHNFSTTHMNVTNSAFNSIDPLEPDLLLVMGGPTGVYQADDYPFMIQEMKFLKERMIADKPTLGICLGAQLMAEALGSNVYLDSDVEERGWYTLSLQQEEDQPVSHLCSDNTRVFQWHSDTFDLPNGAKLLVSSERCKNQIFSYGKSALALQGHIEVTKEQLEEWYVLFSARICAENPFITLQSLRKQTDTYVEKANQKVTLFFNEWLKNVGLI